MLAHSWPGNLRELEHALTYSLIRAQEKIEIQNLPASLTGKLERYVSTGDWL
jgi:transcriptional regulator of acetoin/glycerol metabolism